MGAAKKSPVDKLEPCPNCGSGDIGWCNISVRPYCNECKHWGSVNFGTEEDAIREWNKQGSRSNN